MKKTTSGYIRLLVRLLFAIIIGFSVLMISSCATFYYVTDGVASFFKNIGNTIAGSSSSTSSSSEIVEKESSKTKITMNASTRNKSRSSKKECAII